MLIHLEKLGKTFGEKVVLHDVTASVEREDRIGIVGQNGAGKTTLLKILTGEYQDYEGEFSVTHGVTLGYLEQNAKLDATLDIYGEMRATFAPVLDAMAQMQILERRMAAQPDNADLLAQHDALQNIVDAADGYNMDVNIKKVLSGMGFAQDTWQKNIAVLSGGELTRLRLAKLLLEKPDVLILDEPTNHLDFATMEWLENYLKGYSGAVLVVSHDRYFLDNVCTKIWEVSFQTMTTYKGNFSAYLPQKEAADALRQKQHDADVALAEKLQDYVDRNLVRASTTKMAQSRRKQLEKLEITEAPKDETNQLKFRFEYDVEPWNELVLMKNLTIRIGERTLLEPFTYTVCRGQRLVIAGPNGAGKSTLMQVLDGKRRPSGGMVRLGTGARPSIFAEQQNRLGQGRVIDVIWNKYPRMTELEVRSHLAKLGFRGETVFKPCEALSGGELALFGLCVETCLCIDKSYVLDALDTIIAEVRERIDRGEGFGSRVAPRLACHFNPLCAPWLDKAFRDNGVCLVQGKLFPFADKFRGYLEQEEDVYKAVARIILSIPSVMNMLDEARIIAELLTRYPVDGALYGFYSSDSWVGALQKTMVKVIEAETGVPHFYIEGDLWDLSGEAYETRLDIVRSICNYLKISNI